MIDYGGGLIFPDAYANGPPDPPDAPICAGCGDDAQHWREDGWYCEGCASCVVHQSPYCTDPECD